MRKLIAIFGLMVLLAACDKHDPILPGVRTPIFDNGNVTVQNRTISDVPEMAFTFDNSGCKYTQDLSNVIWDGDRRIFSGFPTSDTVDFTPRPVCDGVYLYAGLTTGEVVKINPKTRAIVWISDVFRPSNLTGGASLTDIVVPVVPYKKSVYAGGLGDAFCRLNAASGAQQWCVPIGVDMPFVIAGNYAFVVATDNNLYAIALADGAVLWRSAVRTRTGPTYADGIITVDDEKFSVIDGQIKK